MTSKKARLRKPQSGNGITVSKNTLSRAQRKAVTAKKTALATLVTTAATKAAAMAATVKAAVVPPIKAATTGVPIGKTAAPLKKGVKK